MKNTIEKILKEKRTGNYLLDDIPDLDLLDVSQNYRELNEDHVAALMESIALQGVRDRVRLTVVNDVLLVVEGHHRVEAIKRLRKKSAIGLSVNYTTLPAELAIEAVHSKANHQIRSIASNYQRRGDDVWERAKATQTLFSQLNSVNEVAKAMGLDRKTVGVSLAVSKLPSSLVNALKSEEAKDTLIYKLARKFNGGIDETTLLQEISQKNSGKSKPNQAASKTPLVSNIPPTTTQKKKVPKPIDTTSDLKKVASILKRNPEITIDWTQMRSTHDFAALLKRMLRKPS